MNKMTTSANAPALSYVDFGKDPSFFLQDRAARFYRKDLIYPWTLEVLCVFIEIHISSDARERICFKIVEPEYDKYPLRRAIAEIDNDAINHINQVIEKSLMYPESDRPPYYSFQNHVFERELKIVGIYINKRVCAVVRVILKDHDIDQPVDDALREFQHDRCRIRAMAGSYAELFVRSAEHMCIQLDKCMLMENIEVSITRRLCVITYRRSKLSS